MEEFKEMSAGWQAGEVVILKVQGSRVQREAMRQRR